jgi:hypothetical protein
MSYSRLMLKRANEKMDHAARHALRHEKAPPLLDEIRNHILDMSKTVLPSSAAGQACRYTLAIWKKTHPLPRLSGVGTEQQPRGELNAPYRPRPSQLDPHRQPTGRTARGRHHLGDRKLPTAQNPSPQVPRRHPARARRTRPFSASQNLLLSLGRKMSSMHLV